MGGWFTGEYSFKCQPVDYSNKASTMRVIFYNLEFIIRTTFLTI